MNTTTKLVKLTITTSLDAEYVLPDVPEKAIEELIKSPNLHGFPTLSLVNQSQACLMIPARIIKTVAVDGEVRWRAVST
jgi:hypothetical protein